SDLETARGRRQLLIMEAEAPLRRQHEETAKALVEARARYAAGSPLIRSLEEELAVLGTEDAVESGNLRRKIRRRSDVKTASLEIDRIKKHIEELRGRETTLRQRIEAIAAIGEDLARLSLNRDLLRERLRALVAKHEESLLSLGLEENVTSKARMAVIEHPWAGPEPIRPSRLFLVLAALAAGTLAGLVLGLALDTLARRRRAPVVTGAS
ncbi:MAG: hypothetical protein V2A73_09270, partial [Pseudomonadota bacterium]